MENLSAFRSAITWTEPFIVSIIVFQIFMFLTCIYVSRYNDTLAPRLILMIFMASMVKGSEYINTYGHAHWQEYCTQNYFDTQGVFISTMICGPLLLDSFMMLCFYLREASQLLIQVKRMQLSQKKPSRPGSTTRNPSTVGSEATVRAPNDSHPSKNKKEHRSKKEL
jgi:transmembrane protein 18